MFCGAVTMDDDGAVVSAVVVVAVVLSVAVSVSVFTSLPPQEFKATRITAQHGSRRNRRDFMVVDFKN